MGAAVPATAIPAILLLPEAAAMTATAIPATAIPATAIPAKLLLVEVPARLKLVEAVEARLKVMSAAAVVKLRKNRVQTVVVEKNVAVEKNVQLDWDTISGNWSVFNFMNIQYFRMKPFAIIILLHVVDRSKSPLTSF